MTTEETMLARGYKRTERLGEKFWARQYGDPVRNLAAWVFVMDKEIEMNPGRLDAVLDEKERCAMLDIANLPT